MNTTFFKAKGHLILDRHALGLALLLVAVTVASVALVPWFQAPAPSTGEPRIQPEDSIAGESTGTQVAAGGGWAVLEAAFAVALLGLIAVWRRLPEWVQDLVKDNLAYAAMLFLGFYFARSGVPIRWGVVAPLAGYTALKVLDEIGLWWIVNNALALGVAVVVGAAGGLALGIPFIVVGLIGLAIYDHYFANEKPWMFTLGSALVRWQVPVLVVVPTRWQFDWDDLADAMEPDVEDAPLDEADVPLAIGTADLALPAMFAAAVAAHAEAAAVFSLPVAVWGVQAGLVVAALRLRWEMEHRGSGAGLPAIATGAIGGYGVAAALAWVVAL